MSLRYTAAYVSSSTPEGTLTPAPLTLALSLPAPTLTTYSRQTVSPAPFVLTLSLPTPTLTTYSRQTVSPPPLVVTLSLPPPVLFVAGMATPDPLTLTLSLPAPTLTTRQTLIPAPLALALSLPAPILTTRQTLTPAPFALALSLPAPTLAPGPLTLTLPAPAFLRLLPPAPFSSPPVGLAVNAVTLLHTTYTLELFSAAVDPPLRAFPAATLQVVLRWAVYPGQSDTLTATIPNGAVYWPLLAPFLSVASVAVLTEIKTYSDGSRARLGLLTLPVTGVSRQRDATSDRLTLQCAGPSSVIGVGSLPLPHILSYTLDGARHTWTIPADFRYMPNSLIEWEGALYTIGEAQLSLGPRTRRMTLSNITAADIAQRYLAYTGSILGA